MGHGRVIGVGLAVSAALAVGAPPALAAKPVGLSGKLGGATLPKPASGVSIVQAMSLSNGALVESDFVDRRGKFSLRVPPGPYALIGGSVFLRKAPTLKLVGALRVRAGKPRRLTLSLRPFHKRRQLQSASSSAVGGSARKIVGVARFTGAPAHMANGLSDMLETDLVEVSGGPPCAFTLVEVKRRAEVIKEIRLQQTPLFDQSTAVRPGHLLNPTLTVRGTVSGSGDNASYRLQVVRKNGKVKGTLTGNTAAQGGFFESVPVIARGLAKIICAPDELYFRITGLTSSESSDTAHGHREGTNTLKGPGPVTKVPACDDPASCVKAFVLEARVTSTGSGHVTGNPSPSCPGGTFTYPPFTLENPERLAVQFDPEADAPAKAGAGMIPEVGDVIEDPCGAHESGEAQALGATVSADDLLSGNPAKFVWSGSGTVPSFGNHPGTPITWMFSKTVTVQRVNADGSNL